MQDSPNVSGQRRTRAPRPAAQSYVPPFARRRSPVAHTTLAEADPLETFQCSVLDAASNSRWNTFAQIVELSVQCAAKFDSEGNHLGYRKLFDCLLDACLTHGHLCHQLTIEVASELCGNAAFQQHSCQALLECTVNIDDTQLVHLCELLCALLVHSWRAPHNTLHPHANALLYATHSIVGGWVKQMTQHTEQETSSTLTEESSVQTMMCAHCMCTLCAKAGRRLWLAYPQLVDEMWDCIRQLIVTDDSAVNRRTKLRLLGTWQAMNEWSRSNVNGRRNQQHKHTQTVDDAIIVNQLPEMIERHMSLK